MLVIEKNNEMQIYFYFFGPKLQQKGIIETWLSQLK